mgnify:FL=1
MKISISHSLTHSFEANECLNKIELKEVLKEEKMDTMRRDVSHGSINLCVGDVVSKSFIMDVKNQENNIESIGVRELEQRETIKEHLHLWIKEESMENTHVPQKGHK